MELGPSLQPTQVDRVLVVTDANLNFHSHIKTLIEHHTITFKT